MISLKRAETRSVSIAAVPDDVLACVADARNLPCWAPQFAPNIRPDGDEWVIRNADGEGRLRVQVSTESGTVDLLSAADLRRGAFMRVVPNGHGSEFLFTLFFATDTAESAVAAQMEVIERELATVRSLCESPQAGAGA